MDYADLLKLYIEQSRYTLDELSELLNKKHVSASKQYLSKLQNGRTPPASDELNRAIAEITGGDAEALVTAAYTEKAPEEIKESLQDAVELNFVARVIQVLAEFVDFYRNNGYPQEDMQFKIHELADTLRIKRMYRLDTTRLDNEPEYAIELIRQLRHHFFPSTAVLTRWGGEVEIDFSKYIDERGNVIVSDEYKNRYRKMVEQSINNPKNDPLYEYMTNNQGDITEILIPQNDYILNDPDIQFIMRAKKELSPKAYEQFMKAAKKMKQAFEEDEDD